MASTIAVIGTGYVGLTTGACFAHLGHNVICADIVQEKVDSLQRGEIPIHEPGLEEIVRAGMRNGTLSFVLGAEHAVVDAEFVYLCVPTPQTADGSADLRYLTAAAEQISPHLHPGAVVVNKSTVPVGSTLLVEQALGRSDIPVVSNPEFLREGSAVDDFLHPDRVVIGSDDQAAADRVASLYADCGAPVMQTDPASAETCKYAANAFLATKLSFANAIAAVCEAVGADVNDVLLGMGYDHRIGHEFCVPAPAGAAPASRRTPRDHLDRRGCRYDFALMRSVVEANQEQFDRIVRKVESVVPLDGATVGVLGIAFKAGTDDTRESPAIAVMARLVAKGATVKAYDPAVTSLNLDGVDVVDNAYAACEGASAIVVADRVERVHLARFRQDQ